jgi:ferredoxin
VTVEIHRRWSRLPWVAAGYLQARVPRDTSGADAARREGGFGMKATVDTKLCIGCELCEDACPESFAVLEDGFAHVIVETIPQEEYDCACEAAELCPVGAISLTAD